MHSQYSVLVSITTISSRLDNVVKVLNSLLSQTYTNYRVVLYISKEPYLLDEGIHEIPQHIVENCINSSRLTVRYTKNVGSYRKLMPVIDGTLLEDGYDLIATADDDTIYPTSWLSLMVDAYDRYKTIICYRGHYMSNDGSKFFRYRKWMTGNIIENPSLYIMPTGKDGVLYDPRYLASNVANMEDAIELAPKCDDLWFKWHSALLDIPVYALNTDYAVDTFESYNSEVSLYQEYNAKGENDRCIERLNQYVLDKFKFSFFPNAKKDKVRSVSIGNYNTSNNSEKLCVELTKFFLFHGRAVKMLFPSQRLLFEWSIAIAVSGCFDELHYLEQTGSVKIPPIVHYLKYGSNKNFSPMKGFSPKNYLKRYEDVKKQGLDPLYHYIKFGRFESRSY